MRFLAYLIPVLFLLSFVYAAVKRVNVYDAFLRGVKQSPPLVLSVFPYVAAVSALAALFEKSGLQAIFVQKAAPVCALVGVPSELSELVLIKPLSGSGATAVLSRLLQRYGADSYIGRCACVIYGGNETIFYVGAVYFSGVKHKKITAAVLVCVTGYVLSVIFSCLLCRLM